MHAFKRVAHIFGTYWQWQSSTHMFLQDSCLLLQQRLPLRNQHLLCLHVLLHAAAVGLLTDDDIVGLKLSWASCGCRTAVLMLLLLHLAYCCCAACADVLSHISPAQLSGS
jgi:hypothetical protein